MTMNTGRMLAELQRQFPSLFDVTPEILMGHLLGLDPEVTEPPATYDPSTDGPAFLRAAVSEYDISGLAMLAYEHLMSVMRSSGTEKEAMDEFCDHLDNLSPHAVCAIMMYPIFSMLRFQKITQNYVMVTMLSAYFRSRFGTDEEKVKYLEEDGRVNTSPTPTTPTATPAPVEVDPSVKIAMETMSGLFDDLVKGMTFGDNPA